MDLKDQLIAVNIKQKMNRKNEYRQFLESNFVEVSELFV